MLTQYQRRETVNRKPIESYVFFNHEPYIPRIGHGFRHIDVYSVGPKWVSLRERATSGNKVRINRKIWGIIAQSKFFKTLERSQYELSIKNSARRLGISNLADCNKVKSHPTKKFGWRHKTFKELEAEVLGRPVKAEQEELDMKNRLIAAKMVAKKGCQVELIFR